ncbi:GGDEF domain-containing protein [Antrihabitans stalagmiti]|uniref:GGDEF domain-containing protein n=1 Tax=Antrihabitans stalagmiti TaxID=2799499 RepID=UPI0027DB7314|nr:GGDEF domain-containing protein [Antrihabitans stalagmiti]
MRSVALLDLTERLGRGDTPSTVHAFMYCDLDRFKSVNDEFGHPAGDRVLTEVADVLVECAAEGDRVCRLGGDEFALVVTRESLDAVEALARRCVESVAKLAPSDSAAPHNDDGVRLSIGACVFSRGGATQHSAAEIVAAADAQLYKVKRSGGNSWRAVELD